MVQKVFFTSDWHLCESKAPNTWSFHRDFDSPEEMNDTIIKKLNKYVGENDKLYHLGDVAVSTDASKWLDQIKCKNLHLIQGDKDISENMIEMLRNYFVIEPNVATIDVSDQVIFLGSHKPSTLKDCMPSDNLYFGLHGHIHRAKACDMNRRMLNVSCDLWDYVPLSLERVLHLHGAITKYWDSEVFEK